MRQSYLPTIIELQAFSACIVFGTTTKAAHALNLTQSAISRSINSLEERLGVRLFHRIKQRLVLSDAGRALQYDAKKLLTDLDEAAMSVMAFGGHSEVLRLAILPTFANRWLIPRLSNFQKIAPNVTFDIASRLHPVDFEIDPFDAAIGRGNHRSSGTETIELMQEYLVIVASPKMLKNQAELSDEDLIKLPLLQQATRPTLWLEWFKHAQIDHREILRGARFDHFDMLINAAIAGLGVALVPEILVKKELSSGGLVLYSERRLLAEQAYCLIYPKYSDEIAGFAKFRDWLTREISNNITQL